MILVAFARLASFFLLLSQKKETKEYPQGASPTSLSAKALSRLRKATPSRLFPVMLQKSGQLPNSLRSDSPR